MGLMLRAEFRGTECYVAWPANLEGRLNLLSAGDALIADASLSLPKLSPERVDRLSDGHGTLRCRFLEHASSSLFILFGP